MFAGLIGGFVLLYIGVILAPLIANQVTAAGQTYETSRANSSISGSSGTLLGLTTTFYCLTLAAIALATTTQALRASGMM